MKFSVLMSLYAKEQPTFLQACLHSLAAQTLPASDIVVVLDGAIPDELHQILDDFADKLPLNIITLPENIGLGRALNAGLQHCRHDWVFRMDTDDVALPQRFSQQCAFLRNNPNIVLLGGQIVEFSHNWQNAHATRRVPTTMTEIVSFAKKRNPFNHMSVCYRKSAVQSVGGYVHHWLMEDYHLWLRMLAAGFQAANLPTVVVAARTGAGMLARRRGMRYVHSEWQLFRLKRRLRMQSFFGGLWYFVWRALPRMLPEKIVHHIYRLIRQT